MEFLLELFFEIFGQMILEFLLDGLFRKVPPLFAKRAVRAVLAACLGLVFFFGGGYWWGSRLTEIGRTEPPRSLWVSIGLAALFLTLAFVQAVRRESEPEAGTSARQRLVEAVRPWRWSVARLASFALFNTAAAAGIAVGFSSRPLG